MKLCALALACAVGGRAAPARRDDPDVLVRPRRRAMEIVPGTTHRIAEDDPGAVVAAVREVVAAAR